MNTNVEKLPQDIKEGDEPATENHLAKMIVKVNGNQLLDVNKTSSAFPDGTKSGVNCVKTHVINASEKASTVSSTATFKVPNIMIGPSKRFRSVNKTSTTLELSLSENTDLLATKSQEQSKDPPFPYIEPPWGGKTNENYTMEVLKSGVIVETISLNEQSFHVIGRLPSCHISLAHPTISRYHAVLQYRSTEDSENSKGFYVYDLGSTHGTFWNGNRIKPNIYVRIQGGHLLRFGCSQRKYILQAPPDDQEEESQYTLTELKEMRALELEKQRMNNEKETTTGKENECDGIDWGMGEEADEETDLKENPYACIADDDIVLDDPKKTIRGWFEREGYDLQYQTEEKGIGQFLCWVNLPMEDIVGHSVRAEALVKGKKKEAVVQCALEACKILDKYGLLRQANHEARKRKTRNWEAEDYYDSDEDNYLDRTGSVERKREQRMRLAGKLEEKVETYDSLLEKHKDVAKRISYLSNSVKNWRNTDSAKRGGTTEEDALDVFMSTLGSSSLTKGDISKMKLELQRLRKEEANLIKLLNLTRPANLPPLTYQEVNMDDQVTDPIKRKASFAQATSSEASKLDDSVLGRTRKRQASDRTDVKGSYPFESSTPITVKRTEAESAEEEERDEEEEVEEEEAEEAEEGRLKAGNNDDNKNKVSLNSSDDSLLTEKQCSKAKQRFETSDTYELAEEKVEIKVRKNVGQQRQKISCEQDIYADNYSMWVPPQDQTGDGKTNLNEKYGY